MAPIQSPKGTTEVPVRSFESSELAKVARAAHVDPVIWLTRAGNVGFLQSEAAGKQLEFSRFHYSVLRIRSTVS